MKYVLEFGVRGGNIAKQILNSQELGLELFEKLSFVFERKDFPTNPSMSWTSPTYFVSLSILTE